MNKLHLLNDDPEYDNELMIVNMINLNEMLGVFQDHGVIDEITGDYSQDIYKLCNNVTMYIYMQARAMFGPMLTDHLYIHKGTFDGLDHAWIKMGDTIIDGSLMQFVGDVPEIALVNGDCTRYESNTIMNAQEYETFLQQEEV